MGTCRLVHQIAKERASTQTSPDLIEKADFSVVQLHFDGSNTCCVVHSVAPWCCGFTRRGLLVFLLREGYCGWGKGGDNGLTTGLVLRFGRSLRRAAKPSIAR